MAPEKSAAGQPGPNDGICEICVAEIDVVEIGVPEVRIREILTCEVGAFQIVAVQNDSRQIMGMIAGRRIELRLRDTGEARPSYFGTGQVDAGNRVVHYRVGKVRLAEIGIVERGVIESRVREVLADKISPARLLLPRLIPAKSCAA